MRDLEIRGAGNLLGDEQSGHVAAIGFELYLEMLNEAVLRGQGEEPPEREVRVDIAVSAYIPTDYVPLEAAKIDLHRRIALAADPRGRRRGCATRSRTASARCRPPSRRCSRCSGCASSCARRARARSRCAPAASPSAR